MKILIVDDSVVAQRMIKTFLMTTPEFAAAKIVFASDGQAGFNLYKEERFDIILSDWNMPKMNGLEFAKAIRQEEQTKGYRHACPIVMITTEGTHSKVMDALRAGVTHYITKPFTQEILIETLKQEIKV